MQTNEKKTRERKDMQEITEKKQVTNHTVPVARTIILALALINQILTATGHYKYFNSGILKIVYRQQKVPYKRHFLLYWSGRQDSNLRHLGPKPSALPNCATPRIAYLLYTIFFDMSTVLNEFFKNLFIIFIIYNIV